MKWKRWLIENLGGVSRSEFNEMRQLADRTMRGRADWRGQCLIQNARAEKLQEEMRQLARDRDEWKLNSEDRDRMISGLRDSLEAVQAERDALLKEKDLDNDRTEV